jgi:CRP-like cAMP-binding protein
MTSDARMFITIFVSMIFSIHIVGCFWYMMAKESGFTNDSWVVRMGIADEDLGIKYLMALNWAFATLTTIGFGEINGRTLNERIFAICWIVMGISFYSIMFGNMTNLLHNLDETNRIYQEKICVLRDFRKRTNMSSKLFMKIKRHLETNARSENNFEDEEKLLKDLPQSLRKPIFQKTHGEVMESIHFLKGRNEEFIQFICVRLAPLKVLIGEILYFQRDFAEEIYMIKSGKIKLLVNINELLQRETEINYEEEETKQIEKHYIPFIAYITGSYFGDTDIFRQIHERDSTAKADMECEFFVISREDI